jgi:hypothetical protein
MKVRFAVVLTLAIFASSFGWAQQEVQVPPSAAMAGQKPGTMMLTIFLRHDQSKNLAQINTQAKNNGFDRMFPPPGMEVVSWYVMMGIGQVVTLRFPAERLREVNLAIENGAWGAYRTEFYPTYDYKPVWEAEQKKKQEQGAK